MERRLGGALARRYRCPPVVFNVMEVVDDMGRVLEVAEGSRRLLDGVGMLRVCQRWWR